MCCYFSHFEAHATSVQNQKLNHGYLAVDFFFLLSGYVIGYAYDDRWGKLTIGGFLSAGYQAAAYGSDGHDCCAACFLFSGFAMWPHIHTVPVCEDAFDYDHRLYIAPRTPVNGHPGLAGNAPLDGRAGRFFSNISPIYFMAFSYVNSPKRC